MYIGIDIGGTDIKYGLISEQGEVKSKGKVKTPYDKERLIEELCRIVKELKMIQKEIAGIGLSAPGVITTDGYMLTAGALKFLDGTHLREILESRVKLPVLIENDGKAVAIAEKWIGAAQKCSDYICVVLGTGVGGGIVLNNQLIRGKNGSAGEFSWIVCELPFGKERCDSYFACRAGVVAGLCRNYSALLQLENPEAAFVDDAKSIFAVEDTNPLAQQAILKFIEELSLGLLNLICCFNPQKILIGGAISENEIFLNRLKSTVQDFMLKHEALASISDEIFPEIENTQLKNNAGMIGAVYLLHSKLESIEVK